MHLLSTGCIPENVLFAWLSSSSPLCHPTWAGRCLDPRQAIAVLDVSRRPVYSPGVSWGGGITLSSSECHIPISTQEVMAGQLALGYPLNVRVTTSQMSGALTVLTFHWRLTLTPNHCHTSPQSRCVSGLIQPGLFF